MEIAKRRLGKTGLSVTILGLGGEGMLKTVGFEKNSYVNPYRLINEALDLGLNFFDSARSYSGSEAYYGAALKERRRDVIVATKSLARSRNEALLDLDESLRNLKTDYLDLWQVHNVKTSLDLEALFGPDGAIEAFVEAKRKGIIRFIGITGHNSPSILRRSLEMFDFDTVMLPVNPAERDHDGFLDVISFSRDKDVGIIGMKVYFHALAERLPSYRSMQPFFRFALSHPISTAVIGYGPQHHLAKNVEFAKSFTPMSEEEKQKLVQDVAPLARWLMYYKT